MLGSEIQETLRAGDVLHTLRWRLGACTRRRPHGILDAEIRIACNNGRLIYRNTATIFFLSAETDLETLRPLRKRRVGDCLPPSPV